MVEYRRYILANERPDKEVSLTRDQRREAGYMRYLSPVVFLEAGLATWFAESAPKAGYNEVPATSRFLAAGSAPGSGIGMSSRGKTKTGYR